MHPAQCGHAECSDHARAWMNMVDELWQDVDPRVWIAFTWWMGAHGIGIA